MVSIPADKRAVWHAAAPRIAELTSDLQALEELAGEPERSFGNDGPHYVDTKLADARRLINDLATPFYDGSASTIKWTINDALARTERAMTKALTALEFYEKHPHQSYETLLRNA